MLSNNADFKKLLLLHSRDRRNKTLDNELVNLPGVLAKLDKKIHVEKESIAIATNELRTLETRNNSLANEILSISEKIRQHRNKQLEVKKNEEYQALETEIANLISKQSEKEDEQIEVLLKIDDASETERIAQEKISVRVTDLEKQRLELLAREDELKQDIEIISREIAISRGEVESPMLEIYDRTKKVLTKPPYIAPIEEQKCSGCNLRVSNDVVSSVLIEQKITQCDQCGRIVYIER
jgi:predicted  nucleic acid-binding Zn-ribbon protein